MHFPILKGSDNTFSNDHTYYIDPLNSDTNKMSLISQSFKNFQQTSLFDTRLSTVNGSFFTRLQNGTFSNFVKFSFCLCPLYYRGEIANILLNSL